MASSLSIFCAARPGVILTAFLLLSPSPKALCAGAEHDFKKWENEISAYERMDMTNPPAKGGVVFIGSSTIARWKSLAKDFPAQHVINRGFGGSEIVDSTHFADRIIIPYAPRVVVLRAGGNDLWAKKTPEQVFVDFKEFVATVHSKLPNAEIVFISLSPSIARWEQANKERAFNWLVEEFMALKPSLKYIDTFRMVLGADGKPRPELFVEDKLHFSEKGYELLAQRVRPFLAK